uniref:Uncharacterized protein AlNc14C11G1329 n=1 Tax=Albugo laibachii Nc14 TaxID=890382 RepID=F0W2U9_9STRA|nr:conserved hypothetical protein [Albugo laibachii Nc14]|eukprot:CCA15385.1 conserved hypothetical protein [Albugo laibachii Nc14]
MEYRHYAQSSQKSYNLISRAPVFYIKQQLHIVTHQSMAISNAKAQTEQLFELQSKGDFYSKKILEQKARYQDLNARWKNRQEELTKWRIKRSTGCQRDGGVYAVRTRLASEQRDASNLEKRLSACKSRESKFLALSQQLREQIDVLRAERLTTQNAYCKEQRKLRDIEKRMQAIFKDSTYLMAERDKVAAQAYLLDQEDAEDQQEFDNVFLSLTEIVRRERENAESYRKQVLQQHTINEIEQSKEPITENEKLTQAEKNHRVAEATDAPPFDKIPLENDCTGADVDFEEDENHMREEEQYFAMCRHLQNINHEITQVENEKHELEEKIQTQDIRTQKNNFYSRLYSLICRILQEQTLESPKRKKKTPEQLVEMRQKLVEEKTNYDRMRESAQQEFRSYARSVEHLYNVLKCNDIEDENKREISASAPIEQNLRQKNSLNDILLMEGVTEATIIKLLEVIEGRSNDIIEQFSSLQSVQSRSSQCQEVSLGSNLNSPNESNHAASAAQAALSEFTNATEDVLGSGHSPTRSDHTNSPSKKAGNYTLPQVIMGESSEDWDRPLPKGELEKRVQAAVAVLHLTSKLARRAKSTSPKRKYRTSISITDKAILEHPN